MKIFYTRAFAILLLSTSLGIGGSNAALAQSSYCFEYPTEPIKRPISPYIVTSLSNAWETYGSFLNAPEYETLRSEMTASQLTLVKETFDSLTEHLPEAPSYQGYALANPNAQNHELARFSRQRVVVPTLPVRPSSSGQGQWMPFLEQWKSCDIPTSDSYTKFEASETIINPLSEYEVIGDLCSKNVTLRVRVMRDGGFRGFDIENIVESLTSYLEGNSPPPELLIGSQNVTYEFSALGHFIVDATRVAMATCQAVPSVVNIRFEVAQSMAAFGNGQGVVLRVAGRISNDTLEILEVDRSAFQKLVEIVSERQADRARRLAILKSNRLGETASSDQFTEFDTIWNNPGKANQALMLGLMGIAHAWYEGSPCINPESSRSSAMDGCL